MKDWYDFLIGNFPALKPTIVFYLRSSPDVLLNRIKARNRGEEREIDQAYLQILHRAHEDWIYNRGDRLDIRAFYESSLRMYDAEMSDSDLPIIYLNAELPLKDMQCEYEKAMASFEYFLAERERKGGEMLLLESTTPTVQQESIHFKKLSEKATVPSRATKSSVGLDLFRYGS